MKKIAACYIRVSTDDQLELSPESQLSEISKYAAEHGYYIPEEFIYKDEGISGRTTSKRPEFNRMITDAKSKPKPFDAVLLWKFSRFARNRTDAVVYKNLLRNQCGIEVISISENIGDDKGTSVILEAMFEAMDEYYSINLSTEVKRSMKMKAEKGEPLVPAPFGYKNENKSYIIDEEKAQLVRMIFNMYEDGTGMKAIATHLNSLGIRTKRGNPTDNRFVDYILRNPVYIGKIRWSEGRADNKSRYRHNESTLYDGNHEAIIEEAQFKHVQELIEEQKKRYGKYQRPEATNQAMLRGLVRCSNCNATLVLINKNRLPSYQCHNYARGSCAVSHFATEKNLNEAVIEYLKEAATTLNFDITPKTSATDNDTAVLDRMIEAEKRKLLKVKEAYESGVDTLEEYKENKIRINSSIATLMNKKSTVVPTIDKKAFAQKLSELAILLEDEGTPAETKNTAIRTMVSHIIFDKTTKKVNVFFHT